MKIVRPYWVSFGMPQLYHQICRVAAREEGSRPLGVALLIIWTLTQMVLLSRADAGPDTGLVIAALRPAWPSHPSRQQ